MIKITLKQRIWMLPLLAAFIFALGVSAVLLLSTRTLSSIGALRTVEYPHLQGISQFAWQLESFIGIVQSAVVEGEKDRLREASSRAAEMRQLLGAMRQVPGKEGVVKELADQFDSYEAVTLEAAGILLGSRAGDREQAISRMQQAFRSLDANVKHLRTAANVAVHKNISDASGGVDQMFWAIVACAILILGTLGMGAVLLLQALATAERATRTQIEMQQSMIAAEQASRTKSEFLALMSHELRTPMSGVIGMLSLVLKDDLLAQTRDKVALALHNARNLLNILNDLLDIAKIEAGKLKLESIDFKMNALVQDTILLLKEHAN